MEYEFTKRWIAKVDDGRYIMYDDEEDIEEWDELLEIVIPATMAINMDFTQHAYYTFQHYCEIQWEIMQRKLALDNADPVDGDKVTFDGMFSAIVKHNNLEQLGESGEEESPKMDEEPPES